MWHHRKANITRSMESAATPVVGPHTSPLTETLMAHLPIARTARRTKSTSTSVAYLVRRKGRGGKREGEGGGGRS